MAEPERQLMWKKDDMPEPATAVRPEPSPSYERGGAPRAATGERATIGRSITISGEVTGDEDLLIQGKVDGSVNLKQHGVTVGPEGEVRANITARIAVIEGRVEGNIDAEEQVILRSTARVQGDIAAPRVVLEDGARFRGGVDMGESLDRGGRAASSGGSTQKAATSGSGSQGSTSGGEAASKSGSSPTATPASR